ncbi:MAG: hypothetical protein NC401_14555, partial [Ruminococcus sp.]|nr:hypothetical protein [Ruminococcus sp.]
YISSIDETRPPVWTEEHIEELLGDFLVIPKDTPTADVRPVVHGKWSDKMVTYRAPGDIPEHGDFHFGYKCSACGAILNKTRYCGNCGAKMDGGIDNG